MSRNDRSNLQNEMGEEETTYRLSIVPRKATVDINGESGCKGFSVSEAILCATRYPSILSIKSPSESLVEDLRVPNPEGGFDFLVKIDKLVRSRMDPATEIRETKRKKEYINMLANVADSETGIPTRCPCGGRIIHEVRGKDDYDTLPGKRFFTCKNYEADGLHYRQPWVIGVEEHIERLTRRVEEVEVLIKFVPEVNYKIQRLEGEVQALTQEVDSLTGQFYNLSVQVADLEKLCFD
uniref:Uncharacterized protein n=1 Tax=Brassica oleracea var. oleracea TaxID=109376 RepID=A0A0D3BGF6_BRAOL